MRSYFPPLHQVAALLIAAVTALTLGMRAAEATPCKGAGAACPTNRSCCSGQCVGATSGGRNHVSGVCAGAQGGPCTGDSQCSSTHCVDRVCCDTACTAPCHGCSAAKTGGTNGTCAPDTAGTACNDDKFCTTTDTCDSSGNCVGSGSPCPLSGEPDFCTRCQETSDSCAQSEGLTCGEGGGQPCVADFQCTSTHCVDDVCCDTACTAQCHGCSAAKTGGTDGTCAPDTAGTACDDGQFCTTTDTCDSSGNCVGSGSPCPLSDEPADCSQCLEATEACESGGGLVCGLGKGEGCTANFQCTSTFCVDGVCCEGACDGTCEACSAVKTGGTDGTCAPIGAGMDPDDECPSGQCVTGSCNGFGACGVLPNTTHCNDQMFCSQTDHCDGAGHCFGGSNGGCPPSCTCETGDTCLQEGQPCPGAGGGP